MARLGPTWSVAVRRVGLRHGDARQSLFGEVCLSDQWLCMAVMARWAEVWHRELRLGELHRGKAVEAASGMVRPDPVWSG